VKRAFAANLAQSRNPALCRNMARSCEVCSHLAEKQGAVRAPAPRLSRVAVEGRIVALCDSHASLVMDAESKSIDVLRGLFQEPDGRRSFVDRRSPLDRRLFPPRPEGRRGSAGRRREDET
jgi:hypothetical protein